MWRSINSALAVFATLWLVTALSTVGAQSQIKLGVFNPQRVSEETIEGKRIQASLNDLRAKREKEIEDETAKIAELQQQLEQQKLSLSEEKRTTLEIDLQRRLLELNSRKDIVSRGFQLEVAAAEARFNDKLRSVIEEFARNEAFTVILETNAVAYASNQIDVTTAIIDLFDKMYPAQEAAE